MPPRTLGPYEILSVAGRGGVGTVYRARDRRGGAVVALKLLAPPPAADPSSARRLAREFEALAGLDHRNVVRVLEAGVLEGYSYLAMELVAGSDLRSYLSPAFELSDPPPSERLPSWDPVSTCSRQPDTASPLPALEHGAEAILAFALRMDEPDTLDLDGPPAAAAEVPPQERSAAPAPSPEMLDRLNATARLARVRDAMAQICHGVSYLHARGLVHRDLKPANIMVDEQRCVRIMDFGLVQLPQEPSGGVSLHGKVVGTYRYMAPEQARGLAVDGRSDLYSLGVILFEVLCGRPPFLADRPADLWTAITSQPPPALAALNPGVDRRLAYVAERLLAKAPAERFQLAEQVADALR